MRVLCLNPNHGDYLPDGVFHGLRSLLGSDAVDYPKAQYLYDSADDSVRGRLWGQGFTLYGLLEDIPLDRSYILPRALDREFDLVVFGDIWHEFGIWTEWGPQLHAAGVPLAVIDGEDRTAPYPYHWRWWRRPSWWFLPRAHTRATVFKREIDLKTRLFASGRRLGLRPTAISIPAEKIVAAAPAKVHDFARHIVDPEVALRLGGQTSHAFENEGDYYTDLQQARFGVTTKRAGWDAMRHYEIAGNGAVPCFRDLDRKPRLCAPHGLDETNSVTYRGADDLLERIASVGHDEYASLQLGALSWARRNTTVVRAQELLSACGL